MARAAKGALLQVDTFEEVLLFAGLDNVGHLPPREAPLSPEDAAALYDVLLGKPVTLAGFGPRMVASFLLREAMEQERELSREELLQRVQRFKYLAVLRPDGYLAWALDGTTQPPWAPPARGTTRTVASAERGAELLSVPALSLSAGGALVLERVAVPAGRAAAALSGGPGALVVLQRANTAARSGQPPPAQGPRRWGPAQESMSKRAARYQEQICGQPVIWCGCWNPWTRSSPAGSRAPNPSRRPSSAPWTRTSRDFASTSSAI